MVDNRSDNFQYGNDHIAANVVQPTALKLMDNMLYLISQSEN